MEPKRHPGHIYMYLGGGRKKGKQNLRGLKKTIDLANIKMQKVKDRVLRADGQLAHSVGQYLISKVVMLITSMVTKKTAKIMTKKMTKMLTKKMTKTWIKNIGTVMRRLTPLPHRWRLASLQRSSSDFAGLTWRSGYESFDVLYYFCFLFISDQIFNHLSYFVRALTLGLTCRAPRNCCPRR